jgi:hypothetical protein
MTSLSNLHCHGVSTSALARQTQISRPSYLSIIAAGAVNRRMFALLKRQLPKILTHPGLSVGVVAAVVLQEQSQFFFTVSAQSNIQPPTARAAWTTPSSPADAPLARRAPRSG